MREEENFPVQEIASKTDRQEKPPLPLTEEYKGWSLEDVVMFSDASKRKSGEVVVHTAMDGVTYSQVKVDCGNNFRISFGIDDPGKLIATAKQKLEENGIDVTSEDEETLTVDKYGKILVAKTNDGRPSQVEISFAPSFAENSDVENTLTVMGMKDLMKLNNLPETPEEAIDKKYFEFWDGRTIPVIEAKDREELKSLAQESSEGNIQLIHGTRYEFAQSIVQEGVFGTDEREEHPTISEVFDHAHEAARAKAYNSKFKGFQTYLILDVPKDEYKNLQGFGGGLGVPAKRYEGNRERLQNIIPDMWNNPDLTWIPPERIKQVLIMKEE